jgi:DMSO/TMAO reductase YedYZ molybdopterin-dependent catalytic subunit
MGRCPPSIGGLMSKQLTVTMEQLTAAFVAWDEKAATDPDHFEEWESVVQGDPRVLAEWFADLLIEQGAVAA